MWNGYIYHIEINYNVHTYAHHNPVIFGKLIIITGFSTAVRSFPFCRKTAEGLGEFFAQDHAGIA